MAFSPTCEESLPPIRLLAASREKVLTTETAPSFARDLTGVVVVAALSLAAGLILNRWGSSRPLALTYQSPGQRLAAQLTQLVSRPLLPMGEVATVGLDEFRAALKNRAALVLDARPAVFYRQGHVPSALNLARDDFAADYRRLKLTLDAAAQKSIIVYCSGGACRDSRLVAAALITLGYSRTKVFTGGWHDWSAAGLPVERSGAD